MKQRDLNRCKIREVPPRSRKKLKEGKELAWELNIPASINGGHRVRRAYPTKTEAKVELDKLVAEILKKGTDRTRSAKESKAIERILEKASEVSMSLTEIEALVDGKAQTQPTPAVEYRVSELFAHYMVQIAKGDGVSLGWIEQVDDAKDMFLKKWGDLLLRQVKKSHAEELLTNPPKRSDGKVREWDIESVRTWRAVYHRVWKFGKTYWTNDDGDSFVPFNPWQAIWCGKKKKKKGMAFVYSVLAVLKAVYRKLADVRPDLLPAWDLDLRAGLRPKSELAGGKSKRHIAYNNQAPLTWDKVHLEGGKFGAGEVDLWCYKTAGVGINRRFAPLHPASARLLKPFKEHYKDTDPVLPCSISAYDQVLNRVFREVGMEIYGVPLSRLGPDGERDGCRHTCLSAWVNETDEKGNKINSLSDVLLWAGHVTQAMLFDHYLGALNGEISNAIFEIDLGPDFAPSFERPGPGNLWHPEEGKAARAKAIFRRWGRDRKKGSVSPVNQDAHFSLTTEPGPVLIHALKHEKHGSIINQETISNETERESSKHRALGESWSVACCAVL